MRRRGTSALIGPVVFFILVFCLLASRAANRKMGHDEHQFIASAELLLQTAAVPYKSYPYFHLPNLIPIYAVLFKTTSYLLLAARLFSATCATLTLALIFWIAFHFCEEWSYPCRFLLAVGSVFFILANPLFVYTSGLAWNHDLPVLLTLLAFILHCRAARGTRSGWWIIVSGGLLGFAIGTRLSFAPAIVPFLLAIGFFPSAAAPQTKLRLLLMFIAGVAVSMLPLVPIIALAPRQFMFGNFGYPELNTSYRVLEGYKTAMSFGGKMAFVQRLLEQPVNLLLLIMFLLVMIAIGRAKMLFIKQAFELLSSVGVASFLLIGAFAPTPSFEQYFYDPVPFVFIGILYGMSLLYRAGQPVRLVLGVFGCIVVISSVIGFRRYQDIGLNLSPETWTAVEIHRIGQKIKLSLGEGKVLTLSPVLPLEGGLEIYPAFATGPFAWRVAPLVSPDDRQALGLVSAHELPTLLSNNPPKGILVGREGGLEKPLIDYAAANGYEPHILSNRMVLWIVRQSPSAINRAH
jgi:hypothetical protein